MSRITHGILINPVDRVCEVTPLDGGNLLQAAYDAIQCDLVQEVPMRLPNGDVLLVDEEGLFKIGLRSFHLSGWPEPLFGRGLLLGSTGEDWCAPKTPYLELINLVSFKPQFEIGTVEEVA